MKVQEALNLSKKLICEAIYSEDGMNGDEGQEAVIVIESALAEIGECEPVAWRWKAKVFNEWVYNPTIEWLEKQSSSDIDKEPLFTLPPSTVSLEKRIAELVEALERAIRKKVQEALQSAIDAMIMYQLKLDSTFIDEAIISCKSALADMEKCEPVAEALHERNRLGYAVVDVIGAIDEIIENAQEVEVDDFLHIAIPIDLWHELQDELEKMPERAELYTSQISKEWVGLSDYEIENLADSYLERVNPYSDYVASVNDLRQFADAYLKKLNAPEKG